MSIGNGGLAWLGLLAAMGNCESAFAIAVIGNTIFNRLYCVGPKGNNIILRGDNAMRIIRGETLEMSWDDQSDGGSSDAILVLPALIVLNSKR